MLGWLQNIVHQTKDLNPITLSLSKGGSVLDALRQAQGDR